jgi:hypothetical protein
MNLLLKVFAPRPIDPGFFHPATLAAAGVFAQDVPPDSEPLRVVDRSAISGRRGSSLTSPPRACGRDAGQQCGVTW